MKKAGKITIFAVIMLLAGLNVATLFMWKYEVKAVMASAEFEVLDRQINELGDMIILDLGYDLSDYSRINFEDGTLPGDFVTYFYKDMKTGTGSSRPVVYASGSENKYLVAFQDAQGMNMVEEITLSTGGVDVQRKQSQGIKVVFAPAA